MSTSAEQEQEEARADAPASSHECAHKSALDLMGEFDWLAQVVETRLQLYFADDSVAEQTVTVAAPDLSNADSPYAQAVRSAKLTLGERLILLLALAPALRPQLLDKLWLQNEQTKRGFSEFGGVHAQQHGGFLPTVETALFLMSGDDLTVRLPCMSLFDADAPLLKHGWITLNHTQAGEPLCSAMLSVPDGVLSALLHGKDHAPRFSVSFPARRVSTALAWESLVLPSATIEQLDEIQCWLMHGKTLLDDWQMLHRLRPGYTALFVGPPGTGKTLTACLLGKHCGREVYKIDLSMVVSKYIGETEKNLSRVFDEAEHKGWILFFDEADALFGKRTKVSDAHDRYANQEVSFLLQRIEEFDGVVILASNFKENIDEAFLRRFHSVVNFPLPKVNERLRLWQEAFPKQVCLDKDVDLMLLAEKHELTGGTILNIVRYVLLKALARNDQRVTRQDLEQGIRRELLKEGRAL